jgi:hypothetical protein
VDWEIAGRHSRLKVTEKFKTVAAKVMARAANRAVGRKVIENSSVFWSDSHTIDEATKSRKLMFRAKIYTEFSAQIGSFTRRKFCGSPAEIGVARKSLHFSASQGIVLAVIPPYLKTANARPSRPYRTSAS